MTQAIIIEQVQLQGFRAYLQPQTVSLCRGSTPLSLAVFAPNAGGKSSLVDSFEFFFSEEATLKRLGKRSFQSHAGPLALEHVEAAEEGLVPSVHFWFRQGQDKFDGSRATSNALPNAAERVLSGTKVPFVIHGYELRSFVDETTPGERYKELAGWFALDPLLAIQQNFRALRSRIKQMIELTSEVDERSRDIRRLTKGKIVSWNGPTLCAWLNDEVLAPLDNSLKLADFSDEDSGFRELGNRKDAEIEQMGVGQLKRLSDLVEALIGQPNGNTPGHVSAFENAVSKRRAAVAHEMEERSKASSAVFNQVWTSAKALFDNSIDFDVCPICDTNFASSPHGSCNGVHINLSEKLSELARYREAESELKSTETELGQAADTLKTRIGAAAPFLEEGGYGIEEVLTYLEVVQSWHIHEEAPESNEAISALTTVHSSIAGELLRIEQQQGEHTYGNAFNTARELLEIKTDLERIGRTKTELALLHKELDRQSHAINKDIVGHTQDLLGKLQVEVCSLYTEIQGKSGAPIPIRLELPDEDDTDQQRAQLVIDFSDSRKSVVPSGYLSDSQIHTLALALRLAAIRLLNPSFPTVVLDDVVTSYDADHRKTIAGVLAKHFAEFQIVLVTHDEQFFNLLKDQLPNARWVFRRITEVRPGFGPVFHDHRTPDQLIQDKLDVGQSASDDMRQAEEEWLLDICRDFGAKAVIRPLDRAFQYDRGELAESLVSFLKSTDIPVPMVPGVANSFLNSLQKGVVENFASHFSDNPYKGGSVGDDRTRWEEFKYFRGLFVCSCCGKHRFKRPPGLAKPVCSSCETPFMFQPPAITSV